MSSVAGSRPRRRSSRGAASRPSASSRSLSATFRAASSDGVRRRHCWTAATRSAVAAKRSQVIAAEHVRVELDARADGIVHSMVGDGGEPAVAAIDDAAVGVPHADAGRGLRVLAASAAASPTAPGCRRRSKARTLRRAGSSHAGGVDTGSAVERHLERRLAVRPVIGLPGVGMDARRQRTAGRGRGPRAPGSTSSGTAPRCGRAAAASASGRPGSACRRAAPAVSWATCVREVGIEDVDVDADQRAGAEADAVAGILPWSSARPPPRRSRPSVQRVSAGRLVPGTIGIGS